MYIHNITPGYNMHGSCQFSCDAMNQVTANEEKHNTLYYLNILNVKIEKEKYGKKKRKKANNVHLRTQFKGKRVRQSC